MIWWMSNCGNSPSGEAGCGDTLERASAMGTSAPLTYFTVTSYFRARSPNLCNLGGQFLSFFLKIASSGFTVICVDSAGLAVDEVIEPFKSPDDVKCLTFNVTVSLFGLGDGFRGITYRLSVLQ